MPRARTVTRDPETGEWIPKPKNKRHQAAMQYDVETGGWRHGSSTDPTVSMLKDLIGQLDRLDAVALKRLSFENQATLRVWLEQAEAWMVAYLRGADAVSLDAKRDDEGSTLYDYVESNPADGWN